MPSKRELLLTAKRLFDLTAACLLIALFVPLLVGLAVAIKLDSRGPVLFRQNRLGLHGTTFSIFKFRTMIPDSAGKGAGFSTFKGDPRVTRLGRLLRNYRLDELPQLFNVALGQMSLVGPRPLLPDYIASYREKDRQRMLMPPGMTGWQQINGGATHNWQERIDYDVDYVQSWTPFLDIIILLRTPAVVLRANTVYGRDGWQRSGTPDETLERREAA